jgi:uncharacterized protein (DUF2126 family)/transglutaminase-like putative cysteine protease
VSIKVALEHRTAYSFDRPVTVHPHEVRLRPAPHTRSTVESYSLTVTPAEHFINWQQDPFGNWVARLVFPEPTTELSITVGLVADMQVVNPFDFFIADHAETYPFAYGPTLEADLEPYLRPVDSDMLVAKFLDAFTIAPGTRMIDLLVQLNAAVHRAVAYTVRMEPGVQTPEHTLGTAIGSCRDSAWLLVALLRELGLAARFVSGYLVQLSSDVPSLDGPSGPAEDFTDLHAWAEVFVPGAGWIGMDATSGLFAGEGHIPLSATPHPSSAAAISGSTSPCTATLDFHNVVTRIHEDPRVTLPYTAQQWARVQALGAEVDARLQAGDVRLTMGGEPTFVSTTDLTSPEWITAADGPHKRERASALAERMRGVLGAGTGDTSGVLVHRGQGKWYPGEPLPRWQIGLLWRTDGEPLWHDPALLADPWVDEHTPGPHDQDDARRLAVALASAFGLPESQVRPAFEDPLAALAAEVRRPGGPAPEEDVTVAGLDAAVTEPAAHVLPLHQELDGSGWASADWRLRRGRVVLLAGTSPAGLRLPLDGLSWVAPEATEEDDPQAAKAPLRARSDPARVVPMGDGVPRTALVVEERNGHVRVFLPPLDRLDDAVDLIGRLEGAARSTGVPVVLEGYTPPGDPRLTSLTVTPDPGVIEVNVQPTSSFAEQEELLRTLYAQARLTRLGTETFEVDGSHGGTRGGNHITLGGATPADSPLLRRPDLLVSLLTYWQRHPSLSYLFSGRFVGSTSQAPRVDEGRAENLYELEIAFAEIDRLTGPDRTALPWVVDRALRHLLTDITGNTHRSEFCIDKMYSPDSARGRLGLLELRGFEMPPHPQMAMVQALLVRALVARFWDEPFQAPLVRHGLNLHGRWLLPHFLISDVAEVAADLRRHGTDFDTSWLDPFTEFRFPRIGSVHVGGVSIELRGAIEPWNVLGEEATGTGTARYVDSSVERVQVTVVGADPGRHLLTCNGVPVPLLDGGSAGVQVGGVRFRAWQPPSALHPTIEVQAPLVLDLVDLDAGLSLGGCTYHVGHPGGRSYESPPVNSVEAESRRNRRFSTDGGAARAVDTAELREHLARIAADPAPSGLLDLRRAVVTRR